MARFEPGNKCNPNGRPKGTGYRQELQALLVSRKDELINIALEGALGGDSKLLTYLLEKILPVTPKDDPITFDLPEGDLTKPETLLKLGAQIIQSVADGHLTPDQAERISSLISKQTKTIEVVEVMPRIEAIELTLKARRRAKRETKHK